MHILFVLLADQCITTGGLDPNKPCVFPWYYSRDTVPKLYTACASPDGDARKWCATELTDGKYVSGSGKWGYCNEDLPACNNIKSEVKVIWGVGSMFVGNTY